MLFRSGVWGEVLVGGIIGGGRGDDHGVFEREPRELVLMRQRTRQVERFQNPIVKRTMHLELQRADAVRDAFDVIAQAMREVIHRIDAPLRTGLMMLGVFDARQADEGRSFFAKRGGG